MYTVALTESGIWSPLRKEQNHLKRPALNRRANDQDTNGIVDGKVRECFARYSARFAGSCQSGPGPARWSLS